MLEDEGTKVIHVPKNPTEECRESQDDKEKPGHFPVIERWRRKSCGQFCLEVFYVILGGFTMVLCVTDIIVAISSSVANKLYDSEQSGHMIVMVVLAVLSAVIMSIIIYSILGVCRTDVKSLYATAFLLFIIAIVQALLIGLVVNVTKDDQQLVVKALKKSFDQARAGNQKHIKLWAQTQYELQCCGVYGSEDYRMTNVLTLFPPDVPVSCCPTYDPDVPDHAQERVRELCQQHKEYFIIGCRPAVEIIFNQSAIIVVIVTALLILLEVLMAFSAAYLSKRNEEIRNKKIVNM